MQARRISSSNHTHAATQIVAINKAEDTTGAEVRLGELVFRQLLDYDPITEEHLYAATCQYYMAVQEHLPQELRNPGSQGFIAWAACRRYLTEHGAKWSHKLSQGAAAYIARVHATVDVCNQRLGVDINAQVSAVLKPLNLSGTSDLGEELIREAFDDLRNAGCISDSGVLTGDWVLTYRQDGRFFIVQDRPTRHLTDIALKQMRLTPSTAGIRKPHITVNEGQSVDQRHALVMQGYVLEPLSVDSPIVQDNDMNFESRNPYFLVKDASQNAIAFRDLQLTTITAINNPRPEVQRVLIFKLSSRTLEDFKREHDAYPVNRSVVPHISIGNQFRAQDIESGPHGLESIRDDLGGSFSQEGGFLERMWPSK